MTYNSLIAASRDPGLQDRTTAATLQEAIVNPNVNDTAFAALVRLNPSEAIRMIWPVAINTEAEYVYALNGGHQFPGSDESVITDGMILAAIQAHWPQDPTA